MVRQGGHKLRFHGQLQLVVATFLTLALALSLSGPLYADTVEADTPVSYGFNYTSSYYSQMKTLRYTTAPDVTGVQFVVYDSATPENLTKGKVGTFTAEDISSKDQQHSKTWSVSDIPSGGVLLMAQTQQKGEDWKSVQADTVTIAPDPILSLESYGERRGGQNLAVRGHVEGTVLEGTKFTAQLLTSGGQQLSSTEATRSGQDISASLPLPENLDGEYTVVLNLIHRDMELTKEELVSLMTHKPSVQLRLSQDPAYANEAFEIYATPSSLAPLAGATLSYGDQTVDMAAQSDGTYAYGFPAGLASATYDFKVVVRDTLGNSNSHAPTELQKFFVLRVITSPQVDKGLLPTVAPKPVPALSTDFAPLLTPKLRTNSSKDLHEEADRALVLGAESEKLKEVVDLRSVNDEVDAPIDTSSAGWKMLGVPWYLWLTGGVTAWSGVFATRWWLRRG